MRSITILALTGVTAAFATGVALQSCSQDSGAVLAKQIQSRRDLIGGPGALGDVGDYLLANDEIRVIVQQNGFSRGFGIYGGSLIDADLQRRGAIGTSAGGTGRDNFSELFPGLFLKAMRPTNIEPEMREDGSATITVRGDPADFVFLAKRINDVLLESENLAFRNEYLLRPGKRYIEITTTIQNVGNGDVEFPSSGISSILGDVDFIFPVGDVVLFGAGNDVFAEGAGFDMRFTLEDLYRQPTELPKLPGLVTPFLATRGDGVSYGFLNGDSDPGKSLVAQAGYDEPATDIVVPFLASAFTGAFYSAAPSILKGRDNQTRCEPPDCPSSCELNSDCPFGFNCAAGVCRDNAFSYKKYFIVGDGDVASVRDVVHEIRGTPTGQFSGVVKEKYGQTAEAGVTVITFDSDRRAYNQHTTDTMGRFTGTYEPGSYTYRVVADGRVPSEPAGFEVAEGAKSFAEIELASPGFVNVRISGEDGQLIPARCTLVAQYQFAAIGLEPRQFLYDLALGERMRPVDFIEDEVDPTTRRYIEEIIVAPEGQLTQPVRPGAYHVVCSRGMEYNLYETDIVVKARETARVDAVLARGIETPGWASGDYHLHAINSVDSFMSLSDRVAHVATEGVDIACSSDHNFVTDYTRAIGELGLNEWVQGMIGLELTTIEIGHFNGFPLSYNAEPITKGSFEWSGRTPQELFGDLRSLGKYGSDNTIVQVNHPRDTILGYFEDYNYNQDTGEPEDSMDLLLSPEGPEFGKEQFSFDFDAIEVFNGKRYDLLRTYRVPEELPPPPIPDDIPPAGTILRDENGRIAFPGALEDWFALLNTGNIYTALGNSDTHGSEDEPGVPRTYAPVTDDRPGAIDEMEIVRAFKNQQALVTNGPFVEISVEGVGGCFDRRTATSLNRTKCLMGEVANARTGVASIRVDTKAADWIQYDTLNILYSGEVVATLKGDRDALSTVTLDIPVREDGWIVAEVIGSESMFPVIVPRELPSIQVSDALGSIAGAFGFDLAPFGNLMPSQTSITYAYAFTNPIFVDVAGMSNVYDPPGTRQQMLRAEDVGTDGRPLAGRVKGRKPDRTALPSLVRMFGLFGGHGH